MLYDTAGVSAGSTKKYMTEVNSLIKTIDRSATAFPTAAVDTVTFTGTGT